MAKFKLSAIGITAIRGTIGGQTFSSNRGGVYVKNWAKPTNPMTPAQTALRNMFGSVVRSWKLLTEAQKNAWAAFAETKSSVDILGESRQMTARTAFISVNQNRLHIGIELTLTPPESGVLLPFSFSPQTGTDGKVYLFIYDWSPAYEDTNIVTLRISNANNHSESFKSPKNAITLRFDINGASPVLDVSEALSQLGVLDGGKFLINAHMHNVAGEKSNLVTGKFVYEESGG